MSLKVLYIYIYTLLCRFVAMLRYLYGICPLGTNTAHAQCAITWPERSNASRHITQLWRHYYVKTTSFWRNYVKMTSFWRYNDVIFTSCVRWDAASIRPIPARFLHKMAYLQRMYSPGMYWITQFAISFDNFSHTVTCSQTFLRSRHDDVIWHVCWQPGVSPTPLASAWCNLLRLAATQTCIA